MVMERFGINSPKGNAVMGRKQSTNKADVVFIPKAINVKLSSLRSSKGVIQI